MKIGIDISQLAHPGTGVARYLSAFIEHLLKIDKENEYILFYSSLRRNFQFSIFNFQSKPQNVTIKTYKIPPTILSFLWNKLHMAPIEWFIGDIDVFITSDWMEPPTQRAKKATILYDLIVYKYPQETHNKVGLNPFRLHISPNIVESQKQKLKWVKKESDIVFCISQATKEDAIEILKIDEKRLRVIYPGL